jgi:hypothetical protein
MENFVRLPLRLSSKKDDRTTEMLFLLLLSLSFGLLLCLPQSSPSVLFKNVNAKKLHDKLGYLVVLTIM